MGREPPEWQQWMQAAQAGDRRCYAMLLRALLPVLRRVVRASWPGASAADLDDAVQDTLVAFHAARSLYDPARLVLPFALGILRYRGADVMRRRRRTSSNETAIDDAGATCQPVATDTLPDASMDNATVRDAIARLPPQQRQALEMLKLEGFSLREASVATGVSVTALKVATHRAVRSLRVLLGGSG